VGGAKLVQNVLGKKENIGGVYMMKLTGVCFILVTLLFSASSNIEDHIETIEDSCQLKLDSDLIKTAKKGQLKGITVNLSSTKSNLEETYGEPDEIGFNNADYLKYDNCFFYIWNENKIGVMDIKIDYSVDKVKEVLGKPDFEGNPDAGFDEYVLGYKAGENYLYFKYQDKESTSGLLRFKKV
jgi:hypothetical protein